MSRLLFLCLVLFVLNTNAADSYSLRAKDGGEIRLLSQPCEGPVWLKLKQATLKTELKGKIYHACWREFGAFVILFDDTEELNAFPFFWFVKEGET